MSDPKKTNEHAASHDDTGEGINIKSISLFLMWTIIVVSVAVIAILIIFFNPSTAEMFVKFIKALQILLALVILFCIYKLQNFRARYQVKLHAIDHLFENKNGQGHEHHSMHDHEEHADNSHNDHGHSMKIPTNILEERLQRANDHINSTHKEEWKTGIVEMDKLLKDLLMKKGYTGETIVELLTDAKEKGMKYTDDAILANDAKNYLMRNIIKLPEDKDEVLYKNVSKLYGKIFESLMS